MHLFAFSSISAENSDIFHTLSSGAKILEIVSPKLLTVKRWELFLRHSVVAVQRSIANATSSLAIAERPRDARVTSIRKIEKCNF